MIGGVYLEFFVDYYFFDFVNNLFWMVCEILKIEGLRMNVILIVFIE